MRTEIFAAIFALVTLIATPAIADAGDPAPSDRLAAGFLDPPDAARPSTYWLWLNGYLNRDHAERELQQLHDAGIRGVCIFDMGARGDRSASPPAGPPFLSDASVGDIAHAVRIAGRLGMDVQLSVASSWDMGGSWVEPRHACMGLYRTETSVRGPGEFDAILPFPPLPAKAPRKADGEPAFSQDIAVLAVPADQRLPGHEFIFQLDPPGMHTLDHAVLTNTLSEDPERYGERHLFSKDFAIAVSESTPTDAAFREVLRASLAPNSKPQRFDVPPVSARYVRLRILNGHNPNADRVQLGEFELFNTHGVNVVASHEAERSRDGADLLGYRSSLGHDGTWSAGNINDGVASGPGGSWSSAGPPPLRIAAAESIIDLTNKIDADGRLQWQIPAGSWTLMRFVCLNTGERLKVPSPESDGLATDHLSEEATRKFLGYLTDRLKTQLGDLSQTALKQLYLASYEVRGPIWTPDFLAQFAAYRGYEMTPYLPVLSGHVVVNDEVTGRFIYDYRKTLGDLLVDAYYRAAVDSAHAAGLGVESEAGGPGPPIHQVPVDALKAQGALDEIRGEFWPKRPDAHRLWVVKETACAAHIYGKRRVHMEAFTSMHHWQDGPVDLKPSADRAFCEGANHFVWHTSSHSPPEAGRPGWVYGAGTHLSPNLVWWPKAKPFIDYLARCSYLLQQGLFVADVCYYYGDQGYNFVPPKHVDPSLGDGFDYDVTNREVILTRMSVHDGRIVLPDGMSYALLALPERQDMDLQVLQKIEQLVRDGATVVGPKPTRSNGLANYPKGDERVRRMADRIWGPCDGRDVQHHDYGQGRVYWGRSLRSILADKMIGADFDVSDSNDGTRLDFVHRETDEAEIYFVSNPSDHETQVAATFRVAGGVPELWDPATGRIVPQRDYRRTENGVAVPLQLAPHDSVFVVFRAPADDSEPVSLPHRQGGCVEIDPLQRPIELTGPWTLSFVDGIKRPSPRVLERLASWTDNADDDVRYFSGIARYEHRFKLPSHWLGEEQRVELDLGQLWAVGDVTINGASLGVLWKPPFTVDITKAVRTGENTLVVEVANTWSNRLVGDALSPPEQRSTSTNARSTGGRSWKNTPLIPSGLLGPVRLVPKRVAAVPIERTPAPKE